MGTGRKSRLSRFDSRIRTIEKERRKSQKGGQIVEKK